MRRLLNIKKIFWNLFNVGQCRENILEFIQHWEGYRCRENILEFTQRWENVLEFNSSQLRKYFGNLLKVGKVTQGWEGY